MRGDSLPISVSGCARGKNVRGDSEISSGSGRVMGEKCKAGSEFASTSGSTRVGRTSGDSEMTGPASGGKAKGDSLMLSTTSSYSHVLKKKFATLANIPEDWYRPPSADLQGIAPQKSPGLTKEISKSTKCLRQGKNILLLLSLFRTSKFPLYIPPTLATGTGSPLRLNVAPRVTVGFQVFV